MLRRRGGWIVAAVFCAIFFCMYLALADAKLEIESSGLLCVVVRCGAFCAAKCAVDLCSGKQKQGTIHRVIRGQEEFHKIAVVVWIAISIPIVIAAFHGKSK